MRKKKNKKRKKVKTPPKRRLVKKRVERRAKPKARPKMKQPSVQKKVGKVKAITKKRKKTLKQKKRKAKRIIGDRIYYRLNYGFEFLPELRSLILKSSPAEKDKMTKRIMNLGRVKLALVSGIFLNNSDIFDNHGSAGTDLFIVGDDINKRKLRLFLKSLEAEVGKEIRFSLMEKEEFEYRYSMFDRYVRVLLEGPHEKLINKLGL